MLTDQKTILPIVGSRKWISNAPVIQSDQTSFIVHFWSMSCPVCHANMSALQDLCRKHTSEKVCVIFVHRPMCESDLDIKNIKCNAASLNITEPCAIDDDHSIGDHLGVTALPAYFLFDAEGKLAYRAVGVSGVRVMGEALAKMYNQVQ